MKKEPKKEPVEVGRRKNETLPKDKRENCDQFRKYRHICGMTQKQWAEKIGISHGLVKRIESYTIACSEKTMNKALQFMDNYNSLPEHPDLHDLEEHILYDVFLTNMKQMPQNEAKAHAQKCAQSFRAVLSKASKCSSPNMQEQYFEFVDKLLYILSLVDTDSVDIAGIDASSIMESIFPLKNKKSPKKLSAADTDAPKDKDRYTQLSFLDDQSNNSL